MNFSYAITEELKGLNDDQIKSIYKIIKSFKKAPTGRFIVGRCPLFSYETREV